MQEAECAVCHEWADPTNAKTWGEHLEKMRADGWTYPFPVVCPDCTKAHNEWFQKIYAKKSPGWHPLAKSLVQPKSAERN